MSLNRPEFVSATQSLRDTDDSTETNRTRRYDDNTLLKLTDRLKSVKVEVEQVEAELKREQQRCSSRATRQKTLAGM
jgi:hypothetical protein